MAELSQNFPEGISYEIVYDPTVFVRESIVEVVKTLFEAVLLVVVVVVLFLQTWRASIIPLIAVPVSIVGTFAVLLGFGFSINTLTLFGLVLAIGIVVDDAIVVVENVERNIELGLQPKEAAYRAMEEVTGPIIAIALVLCAVFVPVALLPGFTGQFYRQFALTIAFSTVISAVNSLTLSPALAAILLQPHGAPRDLLTRVLDRGLGWVFRPFNRFFRASSERYGGGVERLAVRPGWPLAVYAGLLALTVLVFRLVPGGFIPAQDKQYLVGVAQLPDAASLDRTDSVLRKMTSIALEHPAVSHGVQFTGLSVNGFVNAPNQGIVFFPLKPFEERDEPELQGQAVAQALNGRLASIQEAFVAVFPPPPIQGLGSTGGFKMQVQDRAALGERQLFQASQALIAQANQQPQLRGVFSSFRMNVPQVWIDIDRERARRQDVPLADLFATLGVYLGSAYVNDFNRFGRTYQVVAQADAPFRSQVEDIGNLRVRNTAGEMVPLGALVRTRETFGPDRVDHFNSFPTADINGSLAPGVSSGQGVALMERLARNDPAARDGLRVDRAHLPAGARRSHPAAGLPSLDPARLPGAGGAVRELVAAAGRDPDRPALGTGGHGRGVAHQGRQQHLHPGRPRRAGGAGLQERDPDRGVRPRAGAPGPQHPRRGAGVLPAAPASDPDDVAGVHHGRSPAGDLHRRRIGDPARARSGGVRRDVGGDGLRSLPDTGLLRGGPVAREPASADIGSRIRTRDAADPAGRLAVAFVSCPAFDGTCPPR